MSKLLLHPTTQYQLEALKQSQPQAVMISGKPGAGKQTIAFALAAAVLGNEQVESYPYFMHVAAEKHISIDDVRKIREFLNRKTTGTGSIRRVVILSDANTMTNDAQNALLKTLEEPPADTMIILTTNDITALKPTIRSRSLLLTIMPVDLDSAVEFYSDAGVPEQQVKSAYFLSGGEVGLITALIAEEQSHPLVSAIAEAKTLLTLTKFERLVKIDELSKQKEQLDSLLQGLQRVVNGGLRQAAASNNQKQTKRFYELSQSVMEATEQYKKSVNAKLLLANLFLQM